MDNTIMGENMLRVLRMLSIFAYKLLLRKLEPSNLSINVTCRAFDSRTGMPGWRAGSIDEPEGNERQSRDGNAGLTGWRREPRELAHGRRTRPAR